jgi:hypothetical protein
MKPNDWKALAVLAVGLLLSVGRVAAAALGRWGPRQADASGDVGDPAGVSERAGDCTFVQIFADV